MAESKSTTSTDPRGGDRSAHLTIRISLGILGAAVAISLLSLGAPRLVAAFASFPASPILAKLKLRQPVDDDELETLAHAQRRGITWVESGRRWTDLGLAQVLMAERYRADDPMRANMLDEAIRSLRTGLGMAPANPWAWTRLAHAEGLKRLGSPEAIAAYRMSVDTAPYTPRLLYARMRIGLLNWRWLNREDRRLLFQQIHWGWQRNKRHLVDAALDVNRINVVRAALFPDREKLSRFEKLLKQRRQERRKEQM